MRKVGLQREMGTSLCRRNSQTLYITPSGWRKTIIHPEHIIKVQITPAGCSIPKGSVPSGELDMHIRLQRYHKPTRAVVHLHPTNIIAAMYAGWDLQELAAEFPEVSRYTKVGPSVPVLPVTSVQLAHSTFHAMKEPDTNNYNMILLGKKITGFVRLEKILGMLTSTSSVWSIYARLY